MKNFNEWSDLFFYDGENLVRKTTVGGFVAGSVAGSDNYSRPGSGKHVVVGIDYKGVYAHRIIWEMINGEIPEGFCIDHIDGDGLNNKIENLRMVLLRDNQKNMRRSKKCTTGILGVGWHTAGQKWRASINECSKHIHLGLFHDFFEAVCARKSAEIRLGFHENHGGRSA